MDRTGEAGRTTGETEITASVNLDGAGSVDVSTGNKFVDHMLASLARHSLIDITLRAESLDGILHHLVEDTAITLGMALRDALGERTGIVRFGHAAVPMDDSLAECSVDLVRRPYQMVDLSLERSAVEDVPREDIEHFFGSLLSAMEACVHVRVVYGSNDHHRTEAAIKALAVSLRAALSPDSRRAGVPSTKGTM
jgi:imidazoleglycerol-phosphate dehydratase